MHKATFRDIPTMAPKSLSLREELTSSFSEVEDKQANHSVGRVTIVVASS